MYAECILNKNVTWTSPASKLFPTKELIEAEIANILKLSGNPEFQDDEGLYWDDCSEWVEHNEILAPCLKEEFEIIEIPIDDADNQFGLTIGKENTNEG